MSNFKGPLQSCTTSYRGKVVSTSTSVSQLKVPTLLHAEELRSSIHLRKRGQHLEFVAQGEGIAGIEVEVFTLAGVKVFGQQVAGSRLKFYGLDDHGRPLANGVYLYIMQVRGFDGRIIRSEVKKLVILREALLHIRRYDIYCSMQYLTG